MEEKEIRSKAERDKMYGSKWFCPCGYQNYCVLYGDKCHKCNRDKPNHRPGIHVDDETGHVFWMCSCCYTNNFVTDWASNDSAKCYKC